MNQCFRDDPQMKERFEDRTFLKRIAKPEEQAGIAVFYLSDYASCMSRATAASSPAERR